MEIIKYLSMNRITLFGVLGSLSGIGMTIAGSIIGDKKIADLGAKVLWWNAPFLIFTGFGGETYLSYKKTLEHIKESNELEEEFLTRKMGTYCTRQGIYFAAKEKGHLKDFEKVLKEKCYFPMIHF